MRTPIFEQVRTEMPDAPICRICSHVPLLGNIFFGDGVCSNCWMRDLDTPEGYARSHCADCGEFLDGLEACQIVTEHKMGTEGYRYEYVHLCREHYELRVEGN